MRIKLGVFVGCLLFVVQSSRAAPPLAISNMKAEDLTKNEETAPSHVEPVAIRKVPTDSAALAPSAGRDITSEDLPKDGKAAAPQDEAGANARFPTNSGFGPDGQNDAVAPVELDNPNFVTHNGSLGGRFLPGADFGNNGDFSFMYALDANSNELVRLDVVTGVSTSIGPSVPVGVESWTGMAMDPTSGTMYASSTDIGTRAKSVFV